MRRFFGRSPALVSRENMRHNNVIKGWLFFLFALFLLNFAVLTNHFSKQSRDIVFEFKKTILHLNNNIGYEKKTRSREYSTQSFVYFHTSSAIQLRSQQTNKLLLNII